MLDLLLTSQSWQIKHGESAYKYRFTEGSPEQLQKQLTALADADFDVRITDDIYPTVRSKEEYIRGVQLIQKNQVTGHELYNRIAEAIINNTYDWCNQHPD